MTEQDIKKRLQDIFDECKYDRDGYRLLYYLLVPECKNLVEHDREPLVKMLTEWIRLTDPENGVYPAKTSYAIYISRELLLREISTELNVLKSKLESKSRRIDSPVEKYQRRILISNVMKTLKAFSEI